MKGKTMAIGLIMITIVVVALVCYLMMSTFQRDEQSAHMVKPSFLVETVADSILNS